MADWAHLETLLQSVDQWNKLRQEHAEFNTPPEFFRSRPFRGGSLGATLITADLSGAILIETNLSHAILVSADLSDANLNLLR